MSAKGFYGVILGFEMDSMNRRNGATQIDETQVIPKTGSISLKSVAPALAV